MCENGSQIAVHNRRSATLYLFHDEMKPPLVDTTLLSTFYIIFSHSLYLLYRCRYGRSRNQWHSLASRLNDVISRPSGPAVITPWPMVKANWPLRRPTWKVRRGLQTISNDQNVAFVRTSQLDYIFIPGRTSDSTGGRTLVHSENFLEAHCIYFPVYPISNSYFIIDVLFRTLHWSHSA